MKRLMILFLIVGFSQTSLGQAKVYKDYFLIDSDTIKFTDLNYGSNLGFSYQVFIPILNSKDKASYIKEINSCFAAKYNSSARIQISLIDLSAINENSIENLQKIYYEAIDFKYSRQKLIDSNSLVFDFNEIAKVVRQEERKEGSFNNKFIPAKFAELNEKWCMSLVEFAKFE